MSNQAERLALILKAIEDEERNFAEERTAFKDRLERLHNAAYKLRGEILSGQMPLIPVEVSPSLENAMPGISDALKDAGFEVKA